MKKRKLPEINIQIVKSLVYSDDTKRKLKHKWVRVPSDNEGEIIFMPEKNE